MSATSVAPGRTGHEDGSDPERARQVVDAALSAGSEVAEVYMKSVAFMRCEVGSRGVRSLQRGEESGIALRVWGGGGRHGFVHVDGWARWPAARLAAWAVASSSHHPGGLVPRLPQGEEVGSPVREAALGLGPSARGDDARGRRWGPIEEGGLREWAEGLVAAFSRRQRSAIRLEEGWIESGLTRTVIVNSLGGRASFAGPLGSVGVRVVGGRNPGPGATTRYVSRFGGTDRPDPGLLAEGASWRAAASIGGGPASGRSIRVLLEPRAAAAWLRSIVPFFVRGRSGGATDPEVGFEPKPGFCLVDDPWFQEERETSDPSRRRPPVMEKMEGGDGRPHVSPFDGEGRKLRTRILIKDGVPADFYGDSADPDLPDEMLGSMRRDSYRDPPVPGPSNLFVKPAEHGRGHIIEQLDRGLFVTAMSPLSAPGSRSLIAEVRGIWVEKGKARRPVARTLLKIPSLGALNRIVTWGSDLEFDPAGLPVGAPSILFDGAELVPMGSVSGRRPL